LGVELLLVLLIGPEALVYLILAVLLSWFFYCFGIILIGAMKLASAIWELASMQEDERTGDNQSAIAITAKLPQQRLPWLRRAPLRMASLATYKLSLWQIVLIVMGALHLGLLLVPEIVLGVFAALILAILLSPFLYCLGIILTGAMKLASMIWELASMKDDERTGDNQSAIAITPKLSQQRLPWFRRVLLGMASPATYKLSSRQGLLLLIMLGLIVFVCLVIPLMRPSPLIASLIVFPFLFYFGIILVGSLVLSWVAQKK